MISLRNNLPFEIKKNEHIYSLRQKLRGKGDLGIRLKKLTTVDDQIYKLIELNIIGKTTGKRERIHKIVKNLSAFDGKSSVPELVYHDNFRVVIGWVDGEELHKANKDADDYIELAKFNAQNFINIQKIPIGGISKERIEQVNELAGLNAISKDLEKRLVLLLSDSRIVKSNHILDALCFADTSQKNYIRKKKCKSLVYIDVFGLARRGAGRVYTKQLSQIPKEYRKMYAENFKDSFPKKFPDTINFSYLNYLITRIYSNVTKRSFRDHENRKRKTESALLDLSGFLQKLENGYTAEDWIINH